MTKQAKDPIDYNKIIAQAMRSALFSIFKTAETKGLQNDHYFIISFLTTHKDVVLSKKVKTTYPEEITIILQHQFRNLKAKTTHFEVELSFNGVSELIKVPYKAITNFSDPSVNFELIFDKESFLSEPDENLTKEENNTINNLIDFNLLLKNKEEV